MDRWKTVAIFGVGLIGGSIGLALKRRGRADRVVGIGRDQAKLDQAKGLGIIDEGTTDLATGVASADVVVVCTPVSRIVADVQRAAAFMAPEALITDAGSTKRQIVEAIEHDDRAGRCFVGAHPLAGSEQKGAANARADLFNGRTCVLTPTANTPSDRLTQANRFWQAVGCRIVVCDPAAHDDALARTSHLPHVVAAALALTVPAEDLPMAAGAYRDGTRVAESDAQLWAAIFEANRGPLLAAVDSYRQHLDQFRHALETEDTEALLRLWESARALRSQFSGRDDCSG